MVTKITQTLTRIRLATRLHACTCGANVIGQKRFIKHIENHKNEIIEVLA